MIHTLMADYFVGILVLFQSTLLTSMLVFPSFMGLILVAFFVGFSILFFSLRSFRFLGLLILVLVSGCHLFYLHVSYLRNQSLFNVQQSHFHMSRVIFLSPLRAYGDVALVQDLDTGLKFNLYFPSPMGHFDLSDRQFQSPSIQYGDILKVSGQMKPNQQTYNWGDIRSPYFYEAEGIHGRFWMRSFEKEGHRILNPLSAFCFGLNARIYDLYHSLLSEPLSSLMQSIVFGSEGVTLMPSVVSLFYQAGLIHVMVVSGTQVSLVLGTVLLFMEGSGIPFWGKWSVLAVLGGVFYALVGGGASVFRAVLMSVLMFGLSKSQKSSFHVLMFTLSVLLFIYPYSLFDLGALLSFIATASLLFLSPLISKTLPSFLGVFRSYLSLAVSPFIATFPILWWKFGSVSLISIGTNLLLSQFIEWLVLCGMMATLIGLIWMPLVQIFFIFFEKLLLLMLVILDVLSRIPFASIYMPRPPLIFVLGLYGFFVFFMISDSFLMSRLRLASFLCCFLGFFCVSVLPNRFFTLVMIDVGQGDSFLLLTPKRRAILIDSGHSRAGRTVENTLRFFSVSSVYLGILTHFDSDHFGGFETLFKTVSFAHFMDNGDGSKRPVWYTAFMRQFSGQYFKGVQFQHTVLDAVSITCLSPSQDDFISESNNKSLVLRVSYGQVSFLFTGDLESKMETRLVSDSRMSTLLHADVLKVGHHGSKTSTSVPFLKAVSPSLALVSVGLYNRYGHPHVSVIHRLNAFKIPLYRTDHHHMVILKTDGIHLYVRSFHSDA